MNVKRARMWFVVAHSVLAVPGWSWAYVADGFWVYGIFALCHALLFGAALERLRAIRSESTS